MSQSSMAMNRFIRQLYASGLSGNTNIGLPVRVVNTPAESRAIFLKPELFYKNYSFFSTVLSGRVTANSDEWKVRSSMSIPYLMSAKASVTEADIEYIYKTCFLAYKNSKFTDINKCLNQAALIVILKTLGLPENTPWPAEIVDEMRYLLMEQQGIALTLTSPERYVINEEKLYLLFYKLQKLWAEFAPMQSLLNEFSSIGQSIPAFNAAGELFQLIITGTETMAASISWVIDSLARYPQWTHCLRSASSLDEEIELFNKEVLRLYPSLPFVTRVCTQSIKIDEFSYANNEPIFISILGLHLNPRYWVAPAGFNPHRVEYAESANNNGAYSPFLFGPRVCAGVKLAKIEMKIATKLILSEFSLADRADPIDFEFFLSLKPGHSIDKLLLV